MKSIFHVPNEEIVSQLVRVDDNSDNPHEPNDFELAGLAHQFLALQPEHREKVWRAWKANNEESIRPRLTPRRDALKAKIAELTRALMRDAHSEVAARRDELSIDEVEYASVCFREGLHWFNKHLDNPGKPVDPAAMAKSAGTAFQIILTYHESWLKRTAGVEFLVPSPTAA